MPSPSPTITRAVKLKRRPPLTTLATRLIATTRSTYAVLSACWPPRPSRPRRSPPPWRSPPARCPRWGPLMRTTSSLSCLSLRSERQAALAGAIGKGRDTAVVLVAGAVEDHALDASCLGALGDELADLLRLGSLVAIEATQVGLHGGGRSERLADQVVDDLDADVLGGAGDDQARTLVRAADLLATTDLATQTRCDAGRGVLAVLE